MGSCCSKASQNSADLELTDINNESPSSRRKKASHSTNKQASTAKEIQDDLQSQKIMQQVASYKDILNGKGPLQFQHQLKEDLDSWKNIILNIAVIGESGSGKSSLINAILNLTADDKGSAAVGVTETTDKIFSYINPKHPNLVFWDFPGVGTPKYKTEEYFDQVKRESGKELSDFDFFLIVSNNRFRDNDLWFANEIQKQRKQFYFCRTHIDDNVKNDKKAHPKSNNKQKVLQEMKNDIISQLSKNGITTKEENIFLVESYHKKTYDFEKLMTTLIKDAPALKRHTLILSLSSDSNKIIDEKVTILKERIYKVALLACAGNIIPIPGAGIGVEVAVMYNEANFYREQLGIDDNSLTKICSNIDIKESLLRKVSYKTHTIMSTTKEFLQFLSNHVASETVENIAKCTLPIIGSIFSVAVSYPLCIYSLNEILNMCASEARETNKAIAEWLKRKTEED